MNEQDVERMLDWAQDSGWMPAKSAAYVIAHTRLADWVQLDPDGRPHVEADPPHSIGSGAEALLALVRGLLNSTRKIAPMDLWDMDEVNRAVVIRALERGFDIRSGHPGGW